MAISLGLPACSESELLTGFCLTGSVYRFDDRQMYVSICKFVFQRGDVGGAFSDLHGQTQAVFFTGDFDKKSKFIQENGSSSLCGRISARWSRVDDRNQTPPAIVRADRRMRKLIDLANKINKIRSKLSLKLSRFCPFKRFPSPGRN